MPTASMIELLEAGVHFGHQTQRWNPKMKPYIYGARNGIYVIDLRKTTDLLDEAYALVRDYAAKGKNVLLEIETNGAKQVMEKCADINFVSIFLLPPSFDDLKVRITNRHTETEEVINERLEKAKKEITLASLYQYNVVNDTPENAANAIKEIIIKNSK